MLTSLASKIIHWRRAIVAIWFVALAAAAPFAARLGNIAQGGSEAIRGSESQAVMARLDRDFGAGYSQLMPVVVAHDTLSATEPAFRSAVVDLATMIGRDPSVRAVIDPWTSGMRELFGRDGKSVVVLLQPNAATLAEAEALTEGIRAAIKRADPPPGFSIQVTGLPAMFSDLNQRSSADLVRAEMVGLPLTFIVLLVVFRRPVAAGLALLVAFGSVAISSALLYLANGWLPVSALAQNVITMIGLGAGTDYALFFISHYRRERATGTPIDEALTHTVKYAGSAVLVSGLAVAGGFAALFLVNARFVHSLAFGGVAVVIAAVAATLVLLPALLRFAGDRVLAKPRAGADERRPYRLNSWWSRWANIVMRRPWLFLGIALALSFVAARPALRTQPWSFGPRDLPMDAESRVGYEKLVADLVPGWMAPTILMLDSDAPDGVRSPESQRALFAIAEELRADPHVAHVIPSAVSPDGKLGVVLVVPQLAPDSRSMIEFVADLRTRPWRDSYPNLRVRVGGGSALIGDFDDEMFGSVGRVMLAVIVLTFVLLFAHFRSIAVPLKAIAANLVSVFAAYGFLVLLFQDGHGAGLIGITPPGGLNSFVVLMLFTILFGLSMDYEIFLLSEVGEAYRFSGDNAASVASGLSRTAGIITGAAIVMVCLFGSFGFFGLNASREFGLGLAFAVAFDATVVRLLLVPATMRLLGRWNWWPGNRRFQLRRAPEVAVEKELSRLVAD